MRTLMALLILISAASGEAKDLTRRISCEDNYAILVPEYLPYGGGYLPCESFDGFFRLLEAGRDREAGALLIAPHPRGPARLKNREFRRERPQDVEAASI